LTRCHLVSRGFTWSPFALTWFNSVLLGFTWLHLVSFGSTWFHLVSLCFTRFHLASLGFTWDKREKGKPR